MYDYAKGPTIQLQSHTACIQSSLTFTIFDLKSSVNLRNDSKFIRSRPDFYLIT